MSSVHVIPFGWENVKDYECFKLSVITLWLLFTEVILMYSVLLLGVRHKKRHLKLFFSVLLVSNTSYAVRFTK